MDRARELSPQPFRVDEGERTLETQAEYFFSGRSKTLQSHHLSGRAVDLYPRGRFDPNDITAYHGVRDAMMQAAAELGVEIDWGGDWASFRDAPHFELRTEVQLVFDRDPGRSFHLLDSDQTLLPMAERWGVESSRMLDARKGARDLRDGSQSLFLPGSINPANPRSGRVESDETRPDHSPSGPEALHDTDPRPVELPARLERDLSGIA